MTWRSRLKTLVQGAEAQAPSPRTTPDQEALQRLVPPASLPEASLSIDLTQQRQVFEGFGTSLCWWANVVGSFPDPLRQTLVDLVFHPDRGLGMQVSEIRTQF